jgi:hypothetical protein
VSQYGLSKVRFFYIPVLAREPKPASGETGVGLDAVLSWRTGRDAAMHEVYFSTDANAVADNSALINSVSNNSYKVDSLEYGKTYYWKVTEVNEAQTPSSWEGPVWSFSTQEYLVVEDFEDYDDVNNRIYSTWMDYSVNNTGMTVGHLEAPFAERSIVQSGSQAMYMSYDNDGTVNEGTDYERSGTLLYSEAERLWQNPQDWTIGELKNLTLYFRGNPVSFLESSSGNIVMSGGGSDIWYAADEFRFAWKSFSGDGSIITRVDSIINTDPWAKAGVMIRESLDTDARFAAVYCTAGNGVRYQARLMTASNATSDTAIVTAEQIALRAPVWIKVERLGNEFYGYYATDEAGTAWVSMSWNPQTINMPQNTYIGLAVTSHNTNAMTVAEYSNVSTTGFVTGQWQVSEIGVEQPSNEPDPLYVVLQDSANKSAIVVNPDAEAVLSPTWSQWDIPLTDFTGVNLRAIKKMSIGVGNKTASQPGGSGKIYIDDIRLYPFQPD